MSQIQVKHEREVTSFYSHREHTDVVVVVVVVVDLQVRNRTLNVEH